MRYITVDMGKEFNFNAFARKLKNYFHPVADRGMYVDSNGNINPACICKGDQPGTIICPADLLLYITGYSNGKVVAMDDDPMGIFLEAMVLRNYEQAGEEFCDMFLDLPAPDGLTVRGLIRAYEAIAEKASGDYVGFLSGIITAPAAKGEYPEIKVAHPIGSHTSMPDVPLAMVPGLNKDSNVADALITLGEFLKLVRVVNPVWKQEVLVGGQLADLLYV